MESFTFLRLINDEVKTCIDDLTHNTNIFIKEIYIQEEKTTIKYEVITEDGFEVKEIILRNTK